MMSRKDEQEQPQQDDEQGQPQRSMWSFHIWQCDYCKRNSKMMSRNEEGGIMLWQCRDCSKMMSRNEEQEQPQQEEQQQEQQEPEQQQQEQKQHQQTVTSSGSLGDSPPPFLTLAMVWRRFEGLCDVHSLLTLTTASKDMAHLDGRPWYRIKALLAPGVTQHQAEQIIQVPKVVYVAEVVQAPRIEYQERVARPTEEDTTNPIQKIIEEEWTIVEEDLT
jgi:hypothetical protein